MPRRPAAAPKSPRRAPAPATAAEAQGTCLRILDAAEQAFGDHGLRGARVHEIVARAGVNERMLYHHFGDKEGLYRAVLMRYADEIIAPLQDVFADGGDPVEQLRGVFRLYFDVLARHPGILRVALHEALSGWASLPFLRDEPGDPVAAGLFALVRRGQAEGRIRPDVDPRAVMLLGGGAIFGLAMLRPRFQRFYDDSLDDPTVLVSLREELLDLTMHGIMVPEAPR
jgi:TetR/AcrR family transcriptional regulator